MSRNKTSRIPCSAETRESVKAQKRGGESYDELLQKMTKQYDPSENIKASE
jgi:glucan phosphoethanolaminetransferase (alkaline phosphatase superfamily)